MSGSRGDGGSGGEGDGRSGRHPADDPLRAVELPESARCPHCGGTETEQHAAFGSAVSVSQYWCRTCRTVFEFFKWR